MPDGGTPIIVNQSSRRLEELDLERIARRISIFTPSPGELDSLMDMARTDIPQLTHNDIIQAIFAHNPDTFWALTPATGRRDMFSNPEGFFAYLPLNDAGVKALMAQEFDTANPPLDYICRQHETPTVLYLWAIHAKRDLIAALALFMDRLHAPRFRNKPFMTRAVNPVAEKLYLRLGFEYGAQWGEAYRSDIMVYHPKMPVPSEIAFQAPAHKPNHDQKQDLPDPAQEQSSTITVKVVHNMDELMQVFSIRSATFIAENKDPYAEEFDGNDFAATHLVAYVKGEPAATIRLRFFGDFAKLERLCVRSEFRKSLVFSRIVRAGIALCERKGFRKLYGHSRHDLVALWRTFGFRPIKDRYPFVFSGEKYIEISRDLNPPANAISLGDSPHQILRPEGQWDRPGVLDHSAARGFRKTGDDDPLQKRLGRKLNTKPTTETHATGA